MGGNRKLWTNVDVTAVEHNKNIAHVYKKYFPNDKVIIGDAHKYLLNHYKEFEFIWSSPPCPTHSAIRKYLGVEVRNLKAKYPDMRLYQEILFLKGYFGGFWVVENVISWYIPLLQPFSFRSHYYWANFIIDGNKISPRGIREDNAEILQNRLEFDLSDSHNINKRLALRNCVNQNDGLAIFNMAFKTKQQTLKVFENGIRE